MHPLRLWLARLGAAAVAGVVCLVLFGFEPELGASARVFEDPNPSSHIFPSSESVPPAFSHQRNRLLTLDGGGVRLWDVGGGPPLDKPLPIGSSRPVGVLFDGNDNAVYLGLENGRLTRRKVESGERLGTGGETVLSTSPPPVLSPDGSKVLAAEQGNRSLRVENLNDRGTQAWELPNLPQGVPQITALALASSGDRVLVGCQDGTVRLWKKEPGGTIEARTLRKARYWIKDLAFSPDGRRAFALTAAYGPESLMVWDVENWRDFRFPPHNPHDGATCAAFSPDGQRLLSGTSRGCVYLWDLTTGKRARSYRQHRSVLLPLGGPVQRVAFTPDGGSALSWAVNDQQLRLWRLR